MIHTIANRNFIRKLYHPGKIGISMSIYLYQLHISREGELTFKHPNISTNVFKKLDIYQFLWDRNNRLCVILSELAGLMGYTAYIRSE